MQAIPTDILNETSVFFTTTKNHLFSAEKRESGELILKDWSDAKEIQVENIACFKISDESWKTYEQNLKKGVRSGAVSPLTKPLTAFIKNGYVSFLQHGAWTVLGKLTDVYTEQSVSEELNLAIHFFKPTGRTYELPDYGIIQTDLSSFTLEHFANGVLLNQVIFERAAAVLDHVSRKTTDGREVTVIHLSLGFMVKGKPFAGLREKGLSIFPGVVRDVKKTTQEELHNQDADLNHLLEESLQEKSASAEQEETKKEQ